MIFNVKLDYNVEARDPSEALLRMGKKLAGWSQMGGPKLAERQWSWRSVEHLCSVERATPPGLPANAEGWHPGDPDWVDPRPTEGPRNDE